MLLLLNEKDKHKHVANTRSICTLCLDKYIYVYWLLRSADTDQEDWGPSHVLGAGGAAPDPVPAHSVTPRCNVDSELSREQSPSRWVLRSCAD